jgi:hypothetical protein
MPLLPRSARNRWRIRTYVAQMAPHNHNRTLVPKLQSRIAGLGVRVYQDPLILSELGAIQVSAHSYREMMPAQKSPSFI